MIKSQNKYFYAEVGNKYCASVAEDISVILSRTARALGVEEKDLDTFTFESEEDLQKFYETKNCAN